MSLSFDGKRLRSTIKQVMKKNGQRYSDLAEALQVSVPTVKRILTRDDLPVERLISIASWLGMSFTELVELANEGSEQVVRFSEKQEDFFVKNPRAFLYFNLLLGGWSPAQIIEKFNFAVRDAERIQFALEKIGMLEIWSEGRIRLKSKVPHQMIPGGKMEKMFFRRAVDSIFQTIRGKSDGYASADKAGSKTLLRPFEIVMREETYLEMAREFRQTLEKYRAIGARQLQLESREKLQHVSGLLMADFYYSWVDVLSI